MLTSHTSLITATTRAHLSYLQTRSGSFSVADLYHPSSFLIACDLLYHLFLIIRPSLSFLSPHHPPTPSSVTLSLSTIPPPTILQTTSRKGSIPRWPRQHRQHLQAADGTLPFQKAPSPSLNWMHGGRVETRGPLWPVLPSQRP